MIKNFLLKVDEVFFKRKLKNFYVKEVLERRLVSYKSDLFNYGFNFSYAKNKNAKYTNYATNMERIRESLKTIVNLMTGYLIIMLTFMRFFLDVGKKILNC